MNHTFPAMLILFMVFNSASTMAGEQVALLAPSVTTTLSQSLPGIKIPLIKKADELQISYPIINVMFTPGTLSAQANQAMDVVFYCNGQNCLYTSQELIRR